MLLSTRLPFAENESLQVTTSNCESLVSGAGVLQDRAKRHEADAQHCTETGCLEKSFQMDASGAKLCAGLSDAPLTTKTAPGKLLSPDANISWFFRPASSSITPMDFNK